ncbi:endonuclease/exonuclease/phosphatase family protein [Rhodovarius sp.]|uniref:endonuclease/exonuclease/phosphatase family protein n=1 Tax=Rhodovarius sp. TaxID=2972673 RepID=UPI00334197B3
MRVFLLLLALLAPAQAAELKLATWNIAWATLRGADDRAVPRDVPRRSEADWALLRQYAARLEADIIAFQEIDGPEAGRKIFDERAYTLVFPAENDIQRAGFAIRRGLRVTQNADLAGLDLRPQARYSLRRGTDVTVEAGGAPLRLLSIHLNAGCREEALSSSQQCESLAQQADILAEWITARQREGVAFAILGDFNRRFMPTGDEFAARLSQAAPLTRATEGYSNPCFANDARGGRPFIDHILLGGAARGWLINNSMRVMVYAERDARARERLSDHCPVSVRIRTP